ncbi:hypothetical protein L1987_52826 [Smallanthus sonchifolius]|uniref:Uncharacterized protein n=1 Tax=Smallanthus sonchifolius TaxID=185202 RepID=A0ACB9EUM3_9ASTR|nr:hypothetical protein L1987_52826 [Smallanthus sonchifolius]
MALKDEIYDEATLLGFQHYIVMLGTIVIISTALVPQMGGGNRFKKTMRALIIASTIQIILGFSGLWRNVARLLSPLSAVPLVALAGFGLYEFGFPGVARCVEIGLPQLIILVLLSQYLSHLIHSGKNIFERFAVLISVAFVWIYAHILTVSGAYKELS